MTAVEKMLLVALLLLIALSSRLFACSDVFEITDFGPYAAEVYYLNDKPEGGDVTHGCTGAVPSTLTAPNGIQVGVAVIIGGPDQGWREQIRITPQNPEYTAYPAEEWVPDGEDFRIIVARPSM